jgi:hypothetical protein
MKLVWELNRIINFTNSEAEVLYGEVGKILLKLMRLNRSWQNASSNVGVARKKRAGARLHWDQRNGHAKPKRERGGAGRPTSEIPVLFKSEPNDCLRNCVESLASRSMKTTSDRHQKRYMARKFSWTGCSVYPPKELVLYESAPEQNITALDNTKGCNTS